MSNPQKIYILYHAKDRSLLDQFHNHFASLEQAGMIEVWQDQMMEAGTEVGTARQQALEQANLVLLLVSADLLASETAQPEINQALEQQEAGKSRLVPIILRECIWQYTAFAKWKVLPENKQAVVSSHWDSVDDAFVEVVEQLIPIIHQPEKKATAPVIITDGQFTDPRDGQSYPVAEFHGKTWLCKNLNFRMEEGVRCYDDDPANCEKWGGLYTWAAAVKACPSGWHIATDEEWAGLIDYFGNSHLAYKHLSVGGDSPLNIIPGGKYSMHSNAYVLPDGYGFFWSDKEVNYEEAIYYMFDKGMSSIRRIAVDKKTGASCRCVLDD